MNNMTKQKDDWDCRALNETFLKRFQSDNLSGTEATIGLKGFVDFAKAHEELVFCLRGNDYSGNNPLSGGKVCIYRNNHAMFTLKPRTLQINPNYLRYHKTWEQSLKQLIEHFGFNKGKSIELGSVKHSDKGYSCSFEQNAISIPYSKKLIENIEELYVLMSSIFDDFFDERKKEDCFLRWGNENDKNYKGKIPNEYINSHKKTELEKERQQQLYVLMREQKNGYLFYDMEFQQKHKSKNEQESERENGLSNKPDMQAIRFDEAGNPISWVFVEVKSTVSAYTGESGLKTHVDKMKRYLENKENLDRRKREAFLLLNQYQELSLMTLEKDIKWSDYEKLDNEILLVFTDLAIDLWENDLSFDEHVKEKGKMIDLFQGKKACLVPITD